jgi:hypothetical protein
VITEHQAWTVVSVQTQSYMADKTSWSCMYKPQSEVLTRVHTRTVEIFQPVKNCKQELLLKPEAMDCTVLWDNRQFPPKHACTLMLEASFLDQIQIFLTPLAHECKISFCRKHASSTTSSQLASCRLVASNCNSHWEEVLNVWKSSRWKALAGSQLD